MKIRTVRGFAVLASVAMLAGAFAATPAEAKKKKRRKAPAACAAYSPAEKGQGKPVTLVTDAATAEAPAEVTLSTQAGLGTSSADGEGHDDGLTTHDYTNIQIDSAAPSSGLYVQLEFPVEYDYDLFLRDVTHTAVEYSAGTLAVGSGTDRAHSDFGIELISGLPVADCSGFLIDVSNAVTPGGDVTLKYWLGEAV